MTTHRAQEVDAKNWLAPWGAVLPSLPLCALSADSRTASPASAFLVLAQDSQQQSRHIEQAIAKGATLVVRSSANAKVVCRQLPGLPAVWQVELPHLRRQAGLLAADFFNSPVWRSPLPPLLAPMAKRLVRCFMHNY